MSDPAVTTSENAATPWKKAVQSGRCPVCFLLQQDEFRWLRRWVGGNIADEDNRRRLDKAGGFCNWHFWLLNDLHSPPRPKREWCLNEIVGLLERGE
jgi:hypothetical protein